jgi:hypothetical protein
MLPLPEFEWTICQAPGCTEPDRVDDLPGVLGTRLWLQPFKGDPLQMRILRDLLTNQILLPASRMADDTVIEQIADLLIADRLHIHAKEMETFAAGGTTEESDQSVAFPLAERQPRDSGPPPPAADPPTFSPKIDPSAQAAALIAAASEGKPFCPE